MAKKKVSEKSMDKEPEHMQEHAHSSGKSKNPFTILHANILHLKKNTLSAFLALLMDVGLLLFMSLLFARVLPRILELLKSTNDLTTQALQNVDIESITEAHLPQLALSQAQIEVNLQHAAALFATLLILTYVIWSLFCALSWYFLGSRDAKTNVVTYLLRMFTVNIFWYVILVGLIFGYASSVLYVPVLREVWSFTFFFIALCILYFVPLHHANLLHQAMLPATKKTFAQGVLQAKEVFASYFVVILIMTAAFLIVWLLSMLSPALILIGLILLLLPTVVLARLQVLSLVSSKNLENDEE